MGEKIKDLYPIKVGSASFMIELNEGYTTEGRVIHVQNSKFRYLFKELDFLKVAANILRAKSELDYVRVNRAGKASQEKSHDGIALGLELDDTALRFVDLLRSSGADFRVIEAGDGFRPSSEMKMHMRVYKTRPDVGAVVHAHPIFATTFAVCHIPLSQPITAEAVMFLGTVPVAPYGTPSTSEIPDAIEPLLKDNDQLLLANHGALTYGPDLLSAYYKMESVEFYAELLYRSRQLGNPVELDVESLQKIKDLG